MTVEVVKSLAQKYKNEVIDYRRHLHAHPELSFEEYETSKYIQLQLEKIGLSPKTGIAGTGLVVEIEGKNNHSKTFALRADIDALPISEKNEKDYTSKNVGVMHACGHDVHTSSLLGCAHILNELKNEFEGTVRLIFQPGEEKSPGGASLMIKEGVLENPKPIGIIGQHVMPQLEVGKFGFREGVYMASADEIYLKITGKGGHAAVPENNIDPILITSHIIIALQQIVSRNASPKVPTVLSFGKLTANGATNVIPNEVFVEGTLRTMNEQWRKDAKDKIVKIATSLAEGMGGSCEVRFADGYPYLENNPELTQRMRKYAEAYIGSENVVNLDLWMAAEDFAFYTHYVDACFYRLGVRNEAKGITSLVHTPTFDIDEDALELGSGMMAWLAINELSQKQLKTNERP
ncbi:MAG: M20 family metallopeptidase [Bacteroidota bacterium]|nr:M20 family metallopeptidase [Bacteroidota bacterium]